MTGWRFFIDRGGTFTDVVATSPAGATVVRKLLSSNPGQYDDAALEAIRRILEEHGARRDDVAAVRLGTTVATNALLERKGAEVVLVVTQGFADLLEIGAQARPDIFARHIVKPDLLHSRVVEARERITASGEVLLALDEDRVRADLAAAHAKGYRAAAIACLHGWAHPAHERRIAAIAHQLGFTQVSVSSEVSGLIKYVPRTDTTVADAYLSPVLDAYIRRFTAGFDDGADLRFMQSNGGLASADAFRGRDAVLSGPAGGVVGMAAAARRAGFDKALGFDMGGTSTDVSHFAGAFERTHETIAAGVRIAAPMLQVHTVAAGGGSICFFDGARMRVGPHSAGADPGPACYRRGGPLTVTDCNVLLGRVQPDFFPAIFGPEANQRLDVEAVRNGFRDLCDQVKAATGRAMTPEDAALGFLAIANLNMAEAIRKISIQRGYDPAEYALVAFGGAGGQHACAVADAVGVDAILLHPLAGVLSAWGMGLAQPRAVVEATIDAPAGDTARLTAEAERLAHAAHARLAAQDVPDIETRVTAHVRYAGADATLALPFAGEPSLAERFALEHMSRFGFTDPDREVMVAALSAEAVGASEPYGETGLAASGAGPGPAPATSTTVRLTTAEGVADAPVHDRAALAPDQIVDGPALILEQGATTYVDAGWRAKLTEAGDLVLTRRTPRMARERIGAAADPVLLEVFSNRFMGVAEEMGLALQTTAASVNIKERLDFSCAIFDASGGLVANAPHIPVHLGSMSDSVREIIRRRGEEMREGDIYMLNAPHAGGTHLPDITVIAPVFVPGYDIHGRNSPAFFTCARGHHADIGGTTPGSMPPDSTRVDEEGVLIENFLLVSEGRLREAETRALLSSGEYPSRDVDRNLADLKAQIAACVRGGDELRAMTAYYGRDGVSAYMRHVQDNAEEHIRRVIDTLEPGAFDVSMDTGAVIRVAVRPDRAARRVTIDFTGTSDQQPDNFNAPLSITRAATLYVFRTLVDDAIPLNEGCLRPVDLIVPQGSMLNPRPGAAVVAGNVETSQAVVDALYAAMGRMAASQGTMNNFTFGDGTRQYYETICGGSGAGPDFDGASAVQTHMTNSRLTDPEVLETRFPVVVEAFAVRRGSGGGGLHTGGDGAVRRIRFLEPMTASILSNRRLTRPFGLAGGEAGASGATRVERAGGEVVELGATGSLAVDAGDVIIIETPGGGGYGQA
ncbi:MAG: hydantoinase B/oxoprolinase family protein [Hyphomonadaceae bacterium]